MARTQTTKTAPRKTKTTNKVIKSKKVSPAKKTAKKVSKTKKVLPKVSPVLERMTKSQLADHLAFEAGTERKVVLNVLAALTQAAAGAVKKTGCGEFVIPGLLKITTKRVPAKRMKAIKAGTLVYSPATGEKVPHPGRAAFTKPATVKVRVRPLTLLKNYALA